jgi:hypothetical protein
MSEKTQIGWNGFGRLLGLGGIGAGSKPLAGWLGTGLETFEVAQGDRGLGTGWDGLRVSSSDI